MHSTSAEKDRVIAQKPAPGEKITEKITLVVSSGPYEAIYYCPDFQGMIKQEAVQLAEKLGLKSASQAQGEAVKSQKPKPALRLRRGDTIYLILEGE